MRSSITPSPIDIQKACLDALSNITPDYLSVYDDSGRIVYVNRQCARAFGMLPEAAIGKTLLDLDFPLEVPVRNNLEREMVFATARAVDGHSCLRDPQGVFRHYRHTYSPIFNADGDVEFALCRVDISEQAAAERSPLVELSPPHDAQVYRSFVAESAPVLIAYIDHEQRLRYHNKAFEEWYGLEHASLVGLHVREIVGEEKYGQVWDRIKPALAGTPVAIERQDRHRDGSLRYIQATYTPDIDETGFVRGFSSVIYDITPLKQAQERHSFLVGLLERTRILRDPNDVLWETVNGLGKHLDVSRCTYAEIDLKADTGTIVHDYCDGCASAAGAYRLSSLADEGLRMAREGQTVVDHGSHNDPKTVECFGEACLPIKARAFINVPLLKDGRLIAILGVYSCDTPRRWTEFEVGLVKEVAEWTWMTLENIRLLKAAEDELAERRRAESETRAINDRLHLILEAGEVSWWECDMLTGKMTWSENQGEVYGIAPGAFAGTLSGFIKLIHAADRKFVYDLVVQAIKWKSGIAVEFRVLSSDGSVRWIQGSGRAFYDSNGTPVRMMGLARNVTERISLQAALNTSYEKERKIATTLQTSYLSKEHHKAFPELDIETVYKPALDEALVGGDFYDVLPLTSNRVAFIVGDVSGKGLDAAARAAEVRFTLRGLLREDPNAASIISRINAITNASHDLEGTEGFVCLALAVLDLKNRTMEIASAGAEPPLILRHDGRTEEFIIPGTPLGVAPNYAYRSLSVELRPGDVLLLTTDGLTEARIGKDFLGFEGLTRLAEASRSSASLCEMGHSIVDGALAFADGSFRDDICLLLCKANYEPRP